MIISHKYKFIFIKPRKAAGTSMEIILAKNCGAEDIITPITDYKPENDSFSYVHPSQNFQEMGFNNHTNPEKIRNKIPDIWNDYFKFTIVRNPYDLVVSRFFWQKRKKNSKVKVKFLKPRTFGRYLKDLWEAFIRQTLYRRKNSFEKFVLQFKDEWKNEMFYFDKAGNPICDFYIRYENLESDFQSVCFKLGIPYDKLPHTKNKLRSEKKHYSVYYNENSMKVISHLFKKELAFFNYTFEKSDKME